MTTDTLHQTDLVTWTERERLSDQLEGDHAFRASVAEISDGRLDRSLKRVATSFRRKGDPAASTRRPRRWKLHGITAAGTLDDGLHPDPGSLEFRREPD